MTPEGKFKAKIRKRLHLVLAERGLPSKLLWNAGTGYGSDTVDLTGVIAGHAIAIEVKREDGKGKLTNRQVLTLRDFMAAGAFAMVVDDEHSLSVFLAWVKSIEPRPVVPPTVIKALMKQ